MDHADQLVELLCCESVRELPDLVYMFEQPYFRRQDVVDLCQPRLSIGFGLPLNVRRAGVHLLRDVGQLVHEKPPSRSGVGTELAGRERDIAAGGEGSGVQRGGRRGCRVVAMHAHVAEIEAEARLHLAAYVTIQCLRPAAEEAIIRTSRER
jgi:hypothetical protein